MTKYQIRSIKRLRITPGELLLVQIPSGTREREIMQSLRQAMSKIAPKIPLLITTNKYKFSVASATSSLAELKSKSCESS